MAKKTTGKPSTTMKQSATKRGRTAEPPMPQQPVTLLRMGEAAKRVGVSKTTLWRAIQSGKLSFAERTADGEYRVEASELERAFSDKRAAATSVLTNTAAKVEAMEQVVQILREQLAKTEADRDAWRQQAENAQKLLIDSRRRRWWFSRD